MSATGRRRSRSKRARDDPASTASMGDSARCGRCGGAASRRVRTDRRRPARTASRTQPKHDVRLPLRGRFRALHAGVPASCGRRVEAELTTLFGSGAGIGNGRQTGDGEGVRRHDLAGEDRQWACCLSQKMPSSRGESHPSALTEAVRNSLPLHGSCHSDHQATDATVVQLQCANMRGYRSAISHIFWSALRSAASFLCFWRIHRTK